MTVLLSKSFLSKDECDQLNQWVDIGIKNKWLDKGTDESRSWNCRNRLNTRNYGERFQNPKVAVDVFDKITNRLGLQDLEKSEIGGGKDGVVVSCTFDGGDVYQHIDPKEGELEVLRCNIMTRKPESGGELYIGSSRIDIEVGDLHCYLPSTVSHRVATVNGKTPRVMWMFGYKCSKERFNQLCQIQSQI